MDKPPFTKEYIQEDVEATLRGLPKRDEFGDSFQIIERKIGYFLKQDRAAAIDALQDWLRRKDEWWIHVVLLLAKTFKLQELRPALRAKRRKIAVRRFFSCSAVRSHDRALEDIDRALREI